MNSLYNWCQNVEHVLEVAGREDPRYHKRRIAYCREFCEQFPDTDPMVFEGMQTAIAVSLFALGRVEAGEAVFEDLTENLPEFGWGYIRWGDIYRESFGGRPDGVPPDDERAAELYRAALSRGLEPHVEEIARNRLTSLEDR
ncbi:MAG: hypothetical protein ABEH59_05505 [Halobacteriales archaeon]